jgi:hypothetical protein
VVSRKYRQQDWPYNDRRDCYRILDPSAGSSPIGITAGPDGALWFAESFQYAAPGGKIGRITVPASTSVLLSAVLPASRSIQVGKTATAFATLINSGTSTGISCGIAPVTSVPAGFVYQTTNPANNALTGTSNTPVNIPAGQSQSFVVAFTANAPFVPTNVDIGFACLNAIAAPSNPGLNTLLLSASATPLPDIVALGATIQNDGIVHVTGTPRQGFFAVATDNLGSGDTITVAANTGAATLPLTSPFARAIRRRGRAYNRPPQRSRRQSAPTPPRPSSFSFRQAPTCRSTPPTAASS